MELSLTKIAVKILCDVSTCFDDVDIYYAPRKLCLWRVYCFHVVHHASVHPLRFVA